MNIQGNYTIEQYEEERCGILRNKYLAVFDKRSSDCSRILELIILKCKIEIFDCFTSIFGISKALNMK